MGGFKFFGFVSENQTRNTCQFFAKTEIKRVATIDPNTCYLVYIYYSPNIRTLFTFSVR